MIFQVVLLLSQACPPSGQGPPLLSLLHQWPYSRAVPASVSCSCRHFLPPGPHARNYVQFILTPQPKCMRSLSQV